MQYALVADKIQPQTKQELVSIACGDGRRGRTLPVQIEGVSRTPVVLYKDSLILSGYDKVRGTSLQAIRISDGTKLWSTVVPDEITRFTPVIEGSHLIAAAESVWALDLESGDVTFHEALPTPSVPGAVANGLVLFSRGGQTVEARELASGKLRWKTKLKGRIESNIVHTDGRVYVKTADDQLAELTMMGEVLRYIQVGIRRQH